MGQSTDGFKHLAALTRDYNIPTGSCLQLGKQGSSFDYATMVRIAIDFGFLREQHGEAEIPLDHPLARVIAAGDLLERGHPTRVSDLALFASLGFQRIDSLDVTDSEGANIIYDLNRPGLALVTDRRYDMIVDGGTMEHVFHVPNVLQNILSILNVGGYIIHANPMDGFVDHGFFQFSPHFYLEFYTANGFEIVDAAARTVDSVPNDDRLTVFRQYAPGKTYARNERVAAGEHHRLDFSLAARRTTASTIDRIPRVAFPR